MRECILIKRKRPYNIFVTDQRLWVPAVNLYTYLNVMVAQRPPELKPERKDTVINPILIGETLSDSTQGYDRGDKFAHYRTIESFQEYLLLDQYHPRVEHYLKRSRNQWLLTEYEGLEAHFQLASLGVDLALAELYEPIEF